MGWGGQRHAPATLSPGKTRYPLYWKLGGPQGQSGWVPKISPPPGFDPRTVQPVASRYTDCATRPTHFTDLICRAQRNRWQGECNCTEICSRLAQLTDPLSTKAVERSLNKKREMYASRNTVVLYDICILNPFQVAITVDCGHSS
jgi:hypothetical protein